MSEGNYQNDDNFVCGELILLGSKQTDLISPLFCKSRIIERVCSRDEIIDECSKKHYKVFKIE